MAELHPDLFKPSAVHPETSEFVTRLAAQLAGAPPMTTMEPAVVREARENGGGAMGPLVLSDSAEDREIPGPGGSLRLRTFVPKNVKGVYLYFHGGGWVLGRAHHSDTMLEAISNKCEVAVVSVDYRLAPEDPFPAGPDDCEAAALWLIDHAESEFGSGKLLVGGESAGGHLAATTLLRLRDKHSYTRFAGAVLTFGVFDLSMTPSQVHGKEALLVPTPIMQWFYDHFVPAERRRDPDVSPLYANLAGLPPAIFTVGTLDPLLDDTLFMHSRWLAAGNKASLAVYPGAPHGFTGMPIEVGRQAQAGIQRFISSCLSGQAA